MAPRGRRPKPGNSRMHAAIDAMKPFGFTKEEVTAKMRQLLKEYDGEYMFIEADAYSVLLHSLLPEETTQNDQKIQQEAAIGETSNLKVVEEDEELNDDHAVVPTDEFIDDHAVVTTDEFIDIEHQQQIQLEVVPGETSNLVKEGKDDHAMVLKDDFIDIPICSSTTHDVLPPPPPLLLPPPPSSPPPVPPPPPPVLPPSPSSPPPVLSPSPPLPPPPLLLPRPLLLLPPPPSSPPPVPPPPPSSPPAPPPHSSPTPHPPLQLLLPPPPPLPPHVLHSTLPQPKHVHPRRRRKPCHGWIDDEEPVFMLLRPFNGKISPPRSSPASHPQLASEKRYESRQQSRWDVSPEDMQF